MARLVEDSKNIKIDGFSNIVWADSDHCVRGRAGGVIAPQAGEVVARGGEQHEDEKWPEESSRPASGSIRHRGRNDGLPAWGFAEASPLTIIRHRGCPSGHCAFHMRFGRDPDHGVSSISFM